MTGPAFSHEIPERTITRRRFLLLRLPNLPPIRRSQDCEAHQSEQPYFAVDKLMDLSDHLLREMVPVFRDDVHVHIQRDLLVAIEPRRGCHEKRVVIGDKERYVLTRIGGQSTLGEIGEDLEAMFSLDCGEGFCLAKNLFVRLAAEGICHPSGPPCE